MAGRTAKALLLGDDERAELEALTRATSVSAGLAARARIVLLAADATPNHQIAELVGVSRPTVNKWRERFSEQRVAGLVEGESAFAAGASDDFESTFISSLLAVDASTPDLPFGA